MKDKKKLLIGTLCALIMIMAVGYALLAQQLSITGSASITSNWQVEITNITEKEKSIGATTNSTNYSETTASFNTSLTSPGDYAVYEVTITNKGTLDAVLSAEPTITTGNNEAIQYELEGIKKGDKILKNNQTDTFEITVTYSPATTNQPNNLTSNIEVALNYQQDLGQVVVYDEYSIGDVISFNNANWRVIKASTEDEDYITLMKETVLTNSELGSYAYNSTYNRMEFTWTETCHNSNHGYSSSSYNCNNTNSYTTSKVKEFLEGTYINTLGASKLKEIDGYKIRLITREELNQNLGWTELNRYATESDNSQVPTWVYRNFSEGQNGVYGYWTMTPYQRRRRCAPSNKLAKIFR